MEQKRACGGGSRLRALAWAAGLVCAVALAPEPARALIFDLTIADSTYVTQPGDTHADLVLQHESETQLSSDTISLVEDISSSFFAGTTTDYSMRITTVLDVIVTGTYLFQVGTDWGRGGSAVLIENGSGTILDQFATTSDVWWNNDWNNPDVFETSAVLNAGSSYTLDWVGFEGCCGGPTTMRFSVDGSPFEVLGDTTLGPFTVPEPGSGLLVGLGLIGLAIRSRSPQAGVGSP